MSDGRSENIHNRLKSRIPKSYAYHSALETLLNFTRKINQSASSKYEIAIHKYEDYLKI